MTITYDFAKAQLEHYYAHLEELPSRLKLHLLNRLFRLTGNKEYLDKIRTIISHDFDHEVEYLKSTLNGTQKQNNEVFIRGTILRNPLESERISRRAAFYQDRPHLQALIKSLIILRQWHEWHLESGSKSGTVNALLSQFRQYDWQAEFLSKEHLRANTVHFINNVYTLYILGFGDFREILLTWVNELYPTNSVLDGVELYDQVYAYTHIVINQSNFYQNFLTPEESTTDEHMFTFFTKRYHEIHTRLNLDLTLEMLVCFQLAKRPLPTWKTDAYSWLMRSFDEKEQLFKADSQATLPEMEHFYSLFFIHFMIGTNLFVTNKALF